jgi:hypothetical protein
MAPSSVLVFVVCMVEIILGAPTYFVTSPNLFHVGLDETVVIVVHEVKAAIPVTLELKNADKTKTYSTKANIQCDPDIPKTVTLKVTLDDLGKEEKEVDNPYIWLVAKSTSPHLAFTKETQIMVTRRVGNVFLQLDKPIYNPRSEMQLRAFNIDQHLLPSSRTIRLEIKDPNGKTLTREDMAAKDKYPGIVQFTPFKFPQIVTTGIWTASVFYGDEYQYKKEVEFEVREYILPTFEVLVSYDEIITPDSKQSTGRVKAIYTYGKNVRGTVNVTYGLAYPDNVVQFYHTASDINGNYYFTLDVNKIKQLGYQEELWFPRVEEDNLKLLVTAKVREAATGSEEEGSVLIPFATSMFKVSLDRTIKFFKPALPFLVNIDVKSFLPLPERHRRIPIRIQIHAVVTGGKRVPLGLFRNAAAETLTDEAGQAKLTIDNVPRDAQQLEIKVSTRYEAGKWRNAESTLVVGRQESDSENSYILIREQQQAVKVGDTLEVEVFSSTQDRTRLNYFIVAQGQIIGAQTLVEKGGVLQTLRIPVLHQMSPEARLVVYYYATKGGKTIVVSDSILVNVEPICRNDVTFSTPNKRTEFRPAENLDLLIRAAPHSNVALVMVDKAVYLLREAGVLKRNQLFDFLKERVLSCGAGGGHNMPTVFKDAGVTMLTNTHITTPRRDTEMCPEKGAQQRRRRSVGDLEDVDKCCERGRNGTDCRREAMAMVQQKVPADCVNAFYNCCLATHPQTENEVETDEARAGGARQVNQEIFQEIVIDPARLQKRYQFDESWLWEIDYINGNAAYSKAITLKDSITTWVLQGVGMSKTQGMCIAEPFNITAFKTFFIQLDLPKSAVKGEQTVVKATIFNYGNRDQPVRAFLEGTEGICSGTKAGRQGRERQFVVKANSAFSVSWPVIPLRIGNLPVRVQAFVLTDQDYIEKQLHVLPSGKEHEISNTVVLDPSGESIGHVNQPQTISDRIKVIPNKDEGKQIITIDVGKVRDYVSGSAKIALSFWGELLGPVVEEIMTGMEGMVRLPRGCGEQTMIYLGPTLYTARYLKKTGQMTNDMETKAYGYIRQGVQRMMTFRREGEGSFTVWMNHPSSTWLTAFAVKVFSQAQEFNVLTNDLTNIICTAVNWISKYRNPDGSLFDPYKTHHQGDMVGAVHDKQTLTAFILISLLEADCQIQESKAAIQAAIGYLQSELKSLTRPYDIAITTYALALADSPKKTEANDLLKKMAFYDEGLNQRHWPSKLQGVKLKHGLSAPSLEVETAGYALLAQLKLGDLEYSHAIVNWLIAQRQGKGVYRSTQDTVIGLQALTEYRINTDRSDLEMDIVITSDKDMEWDESLALTTEDVLLHHQIELSDHIGHTLSVQANGRGVAYMDFQMSYNVKVPRTGPQGEQENCMFEIITAIGDCPGGNAVEQDQGEEEEERCSQLTISAKYLGEDSTGMVMIDAGLFTGFEAIKEDLELIKNTKGNKIAQYELSDRTVHFYVDEILPGNVVSVSFRIVEKFSVGNVQSVPVKVYKYYDPDVSCTKFYHPDRGSALLTYNCIGDVCQCLAGQCGKCYNVNGEGTQPLQYSAMKMKACGVGETVDYVINATVTRIEFTDVEERVTAMVEFVAKQGNDLGMLVGSEIVLIKEYECACPFLKEGVTYLIMGMDGIAEPAEGGGEKYSYYMNSDTYVTEYLGNRWRELRGLSQRIGKQQERFLKVQHSKGCPT